MKIFLSIFSVSISLFFFFSLSIAAYSWIFYLSATIHKDYMFLFCNSLLVFICLNYRSSVSPEKDRCQELAGKRHTAWCCESRLWDRRRTVGEVRETLSVVVEETYGDDYCDLVTGDDKTLFVIVEVTRADELDAVEDGKTLSVIEETKGDELEMVEDDKTLSVIEETQDEDFEVEDAKTLRVIEELQDDEFKVVEDDTTLLVIEEIQDEEFKVVEDAKTLRVIEELQDEEFEVVENDTTLSAIEETQDDELETVEGDRTLSVVEEIHNDDEQEQGSSVDTISLEELNRKCEEFIRRMKKDIRIEILTI